MRRGLARAALLLPRSAIAAVLCSKTAIGGKVLEGETHRVEELVATCTRLILPVQGLLLTYSQNFSRFTRGVFQRRNVRRRFRRGCAEDIVQYPHAPLDW